MNLLRTLICGLVAGAVWTALSFFVIATLGASFASELPGAGLSNRTGATHLTMVASNLVAGVWVVWLYSVLRTATGRSLLACSLIGSVAWWVIVSQQSTKWAALVGISAESALALGALTLPAMFVSVFVGAWLLERTPKASGGSGY